MNRRSFVYAATPGPDRHHYGAVDFRGAPFVHAALRTAYRIARRSCDPIEARIVVVTAFAGGLGGDSCTPRSSSAWSVTFMRPALRLVGGS